MKIGGFLKQSLIDYPDHLAAVVFLSGCNFHCPFCHNPSLVSGNCLETFSPDTVFDFLKKRKKWLDAVVVSGGEPTLTSDLTGFLARLKSMNFLVKLDTNGSRPEVLREILSRSLADYIAMDIKTAPAQYHPDIWQHQDCTPIAKSISLIRESGIAHEFRTTAVKKLVTRQTIHQMGSAIEGAGLWVLQPFRDATILTPGYFTSEPPGYTEKELRALAALAEPYVRQLHIRSS